MGQTDGRPKNMPHSCNIGVVKLKIWIRKHVSELRQNISRVCDGVVSPFWLLWVKAEVVHIWNTTPRLPHYIQGGGVQVSRPCQTKEVLHLSNLLLHDRRGANPPHWHSVSASGIQVVKPPEVALWWEECSPRGSGTYSLWMALKAFIL